MKHSLGRLINSLSCICFGLVIVTVKELTNLNYPQCSLGESWHSEFCCCTTLCILIQQATGLITVPHSRSDVLFLLPGKNVNCMLTVSSCVRSSICEGKDREEEEHD